MKRLLHILAYKPRGTRTIDDFMYKLAEEARNRGWEVRFAVTELPPPDFEEKLRSVGASCFRFDHPLTWNSIKELRRECGDWQPDVTQTSFLSAFSRPLLSLKRSGFTKRLIVIDQSSGTGPDPKSWLTPIRRLRGRMVGRVVDAFAPVSEYNARRSVERVFLPPDKIHTIQNGILLARFPNPVRTTGRPVRIAYAGQLIPEKGVSTLIKAVTLLRDESVEFEVQIAGAGRQRQELEDECVRSELKNVHFRGHVDNMPEFFGQADVVVVPSEWAEAFGYVVIEAMACGAAVIGSDSGAIPEVIGSAGLVFRAGNPDELAERLRRLLQSPDERNRLAIAGRQRVESYFRILRKVHRHIDLCEAVLANSPYPDDKNTPLPKQPEVGPLNNTDREV